MNHDLPLILIADDDAHLRTALTARLIQAGFEVVAAADGNTAIEMIRKRRPDAALLDVHMTGTDGFAVCETIRRDADFADLPILFLTGVQDGIVRNNLPALTAAAGGSQFITKPFDGEALIKTLRTTLEQSGCRRPVLDA